MGGWGFYDDDNDNVADIWIDIEKNVMPKCFEEIENNIETEYEALNTIRRSYVKKNQNKLYDNIKKWLIKFKKTMNKEGYRDPYINISGIALKAVRFLQDLPSADPLGAGIFDSKIPTNLPKGYPEWLRREAVNAIKIQIDEINENKLAWKDIKKREKALKEELSLFSKEKYLEKNNKKNSRKSSRANFRKKKSSRQNSRKLSRTNSKKTSRQNSRKLSRTNSKKIRKGPEISATSVKIGTKKIGNDGNIWQVKSFDTKYGQVQRWVRYN